jgi:predicted nucleic acid-binding protein
MGMTYIDTNILVYSALAHPKYGKACKRIIDDIQDRKIEAHCSYLVPVELLGSIAKIDSKKVGIITRAFFSLPIRMIDINEEILDLAANIAREYKISYDSIHVASMRSLGIKEVITEDVNHFRKVKGIKVISSLEY